jgi:hypothetical protein
MIKKLFDNEIRSFEINVLQIANIYVHLCSKYLYEKVVSIRLDYNYAIKQYTSKYSVY